MSYCIEVRKLLNVSPCVKHLPIPCVSGMRRKFSWWVSFNGI